jgi:hypothetical protein
LLLGSLQTVFLQTAAWLAVLIYSKEMCSIPISSIGLLGDLKDKDAEIALT